MSKKIINGEAVEKHIITQYSFKELDENSLNEERCDNDKESKKTEIRDNEKKQQESPNHNEIIEKLLSKIEELGNNIVNIQVQFEKQLNDCKSQIETEKQKAYEEGLKEGEKRAKESVSKEIEEKLNLLNESIKKIDGANEIFEEKILSIEKELISVALDIAKEVIQKEVNDNSKEIAYNLAKSLMEDVKDATKIKIKVNPKDAEYIKNQNLKNVEIIEDTAVKEGGVIIISDIGNIDAQILQRFKAIKESILEGNE